MQREKLESILQQLVEDSRSLWVPSSIAEYDSPPTCLSFLRDHVGQSVPCVWRGAACDWPAVGKWSEDHHDYLRSKVGSKIVDVAWTPNGRADAIVDLKPAGSELSTRVFAMPEVRKQSFAEMLDGLNSGCAGTASPHRCKIGLPAGAGLGIPYYSAQDSSLSKDMPELLDDIDESLIGFAVEAFAAEASATNVWVGDERSVTTMHADPFENLYAVVAGTKIFTLRPPCDAAVVRKPNLPRARWERRDVARGVLKAEELADAEGERELEPETEYDGWRLVAEDGETRWVDEGSIDARCGKDVVVRLNAGDLLYLPALWCTFGLSLWRLPLATKDGAARTNDKP